MVAQLEVEEVVDTEPLLVAVSLEPANSALDFALERIVGKRAGMPVHTALVGPPLEYYT